jgi:hypothetical protein
MYPRALACLRIMPLLLSAGAVSAAQDPDPFAAAASNALSAREGLHRCHHYVEGWLELSDPVSGLIPRNRQDRFWNAADAAADNYAFMVLTCALTDRPLFEGRMREMLAAEIRLSSRIDRLPDSYDFATCDFKSAQADLDSILFGASEYVKDGLLPVTEWLGDSPWSERMIALLDDIWKHAPLETPRGKIVSDNDEVNGEMLQSLSRVYWMTGDDKYLDWAVRLGDYYLLGDRHPTRDSRHLRLRDHGCEIVSGLCELYAAVHFARPQKKAEYEKPLHAMLDRILEVGRNADGLFFNAINPDSGDQTWKGVADTWGYTFNGFYTVYLLDGTEAYRAATLKAMGCLEKSYSSYAWEGSSSDGYADSIESAINLLQREHVASTARWVETEMRVMWSKQGTDGVIEGWHGDGNFARTTAMYCLWKTMGLTAHPWRVDLSFGAALEGGELYIAIDSPLPWTGRLHFDRARHRAQLHLPLDYPRINQFPEWFCVDPGASYQLHGLPDRAAAEFSGQQLIDGLPLELAAGQPLRLRLQSIAKED